MNFTVAAAVAMLLAGAVAAEGPEPGCYMRDYSDAHLAAHPAQVVDRMVMSITRWDEETVVDLWVTTANQGHAARDGTGGQRFHQFLICWAARDNSVHCAVECDGGAMTVTRQDAGGLTFATRNLWVGETEACGGAVDLAEVPGENVTYRLDAAPDAVCAAEN